MLPSVKYFFIRNLTVLTEPALQLIQAVSQMANPFARQPAMYAGEGYEDYMAAQQHSFYHPALQHPFQRRPVYLDNRAISATTPAAMHRPVESTPRVVSASGRERVGRSRSPSLSPSSASPQQPRRDTGSGPGKGSGRKKQRKNL